MAAYGWLGAVRGGVGAVSVRGVVETGSESLKKSLGFLKAGC